MKKIVLILAALAMCINFTGCSTLALAGIVGGACMINRFVTSPKEEPRNEEINLPDETQPPVISDEALVKNLIYNGDQLCLKGDYKGALGKYDGALGVRESSEVCMKIAYCLDKLGKKREARIMNIHAKNLKERIGG